MRIGVLVVAYNAETTLKSTLDRLPLQMVDRIEHVLVCDDASTDNTHQTALNYRDSATIPVTVLRHPQNLGYGGNQKQGYRWFIDQGYDVVVMLHGDGQYAPEVIGDLIEPFETGLADAVFGSRMLLRGAARRGGMPAYKHVGNRILSTTQNALTGMHLSEWHSGYRAYRIEALRDLDFESYSNGFDFDTEIILGLCRAEKLIEEVAIPTYYGDEICRVNGLAYAKDVMIDVLRHRLGQMGFGATSSSATANENAYAMKVSDRSSHGVLLSWLSTNRASRVLDIGCSDGKFAAMASEYGHTVDGVDLVKYEGVGARLSQFIEADLNTGLPAELDEQYNIVVAADVLEHVIDPDRLLVDAIERLAAGGEILISIPNVGHWYPRLRIASGRFDYDDRGPLDRGHVRFFTRRMINRMIKRHGLTIESKDVVGTPWELASRKRRPGRMLTAIATLDSVLVRIWPTLFGYQFLYRLKPRD